MKILKIFKKPVFLITLVVLAAVLSVSFLSVSAAEDFGDVDEYRVGMQGNLILKLTVNTTGMGGNDYFEISVDGKKDNVKVSDITDGTISVKLAPADMNKTVTVTAKKSDGTEGCKNTFNVADYATKVLARTDAPYTDSHDAMRTLLNWGAKSEAFFGTGTSININEIFTRGTDPSTVVTAESINKPDKKDVTASGVFEKQTHILDLILNEGNISLLFKLKASSELKTAQVTITRGETTIANQQAVTYSNDGYYTVKINGITTSLFDDVYTVEVSDGTESNKITAQASVLEYLKAIVGGEADVEGQEENNAKRIATAQALFQFYQATVAGAYPAECTHPAGNFFWIHKAGESGVSYCRCSLCFGDLNTKVPDSINFFANFKTMSYSDGSAATNMKDDATNIEYTNIGTKGKANVYITNGGFVDAAPITSAKYLAIKYRTPNNGFSIYFQGGNDAVFTRIGTFNNTNEGQRWRVSVIELNHAFSGFNDETIKLEADCAVSVDIAYIAFIDSYAEARELMTDDTLVILGHYEGTSSNLITNTVAKEKYEIDCSSGHSVTAVNSDNVAGGTKYTYRCSSEWCNFTYETTVPANINYYSDLVTMKDLAGNNNAVFSKYMYDEANDVLFNRLTIPNEKANILYVTGQEFKNADLINARYLVVKYRAMDGSKDQINFDVVKTQNGTTEKTLITDSDKVYLYTVGGSKWRVCVIDMKDKIQSSDSEIYIQALVVNHIDIAYVAITDTLAEVKGLLTEQDYSGSDVMLREYNPSKGQPSHVRSVQGGKTVEEVLAD